METALAKSLASATWATSLLTPSLPYRAVSTRTKSSLAPQTFSQIADPLKNTMASSLSGRFRMLFEVGDRAQKGIVDATDSILRLKFSELPRPSLDIAEPLVQLGRLVPGPSDWYVNWQELRNKVEIYDLVQNIESHVNATPSVPIAELVERAYRLGDFPALWAVEGLGHYFAENALKQDPQPRRLLANPERLGLPRKSLTMMNAGMGLGFAEQLFESLNEKTGAVEVDQALAYFVRQCNDNATPGYTGCALESLGLVTRTFNKKYMKALDAAILRTGDEALLGYFWHGAGRANYFTLENFLPCLGISWLQLVKQAPHEIGKRNLVAGLAWAITMVNMRNPQILEKLLKHRGTEIKSVDHEAFSNGVSSSVIVRQDISPNSKLLTLICGRQNENENANWRDLIENPCAIAMERLHPYFKQNQQLGQVFRFMTRAKSRLG